MSSNIHRDRWPPNFKVIEGKRPPPPPPIKPNRQADSSVDDLNIVILGATGVGKTTWINAFYNYLRFAELKEAESAGLDFLIPMQITVTDDEYQPIVIQCGSSSNECYQDGESCTKQPVSYEFNWTSGRRVRLIDTPGIGDCAGISQDDKNFDMIVKQIQSVNQVHAILILLKSNDTRLDVMFKFCLKQLLLYLPRRSCKNIAFCFTNARGTHYRPGESVRLLDTLLKSGDVGISLNKQTMYCFDNESVRFLAGRKHGIHYKSSEIESFSSSWKIAVEETERLFGHISQLEPVATSTVATIKETRDLIHLLLKPMVDISVRIQENIREAQDRQSDIKMGKDLCKSLGEKAAVTMETFVFEKLTTPRTVCTSVKCIEAVQYGEEEALVGRICHDNCKIIAFKALGWTCKCFDWQLNCRKCRCPFSKHLNVDFETRVVHKSDPELQLQLSKAKSALEKNQIIAAEVQRCVIDLKKEETEILKACVSFHNFILAEAIMFQNDAMEDYLELLIHNEKNLSVNSDDRSRKLQDLEKMLENYKEEIRLQEEMLQNNTLKGSQISSRKNIIDLMVNLCQLPRMGGAIKSLIEEAKPATNQEFQSQSVRVKMEEQNFLKLISKR